MQLCQLPNMTKETPLFKPILHSDMLESDIFCSQITENPSSKSW